MLSKTIQDAINDQINKELYSSYLYLSMATYYAESNLSGFAAWMRVQSSEEYAHAMKFYGYVIERNGHVELEAIEKPHSKFKSPVDVFKQVLEHEQKVTAMINRIYELAANAAGTTANIVHISTDVIAKYDSEWGGDLLGDKMHSMIFDNSKIKQFVPGFSAPIPFSQGIEEIVAWHDADPARQVVDEPLDRLMDKIIAHWEAAF